MKYLTRTLVLVAVSWSLLAPVAAAHAQGSDPAAPSPAAAEGRSRFSLGFQFGGHVTWIRERVASSELEGFAFGGVTVVSLSDRFAVAGEAMYVRKGWASRASSDGDSPERESQYNYLEIPLLVRYFPTPATNRRLFLSGGGALAVLVGRRYEVDGIRQPIDDERLGTIDASLMFGAGVDLVFRSAVLCFEVRYSHGMVDVAGHHSLAALFGSIRF